VRSDIQIDIIKHCWQPYKQDNNLDEGIFECFEQFIGRWMDLFGDGIDQEQNVFQPVGRQGVG